jgi:hypothetical protein
VAVRADGKKQLLQQEKYLNPLPLFSYALA